MKNMIDEIFFQFLTIFKESKYKILLKDFQRIENLYNSRQLEFFDKESTYKKIQIYDLQGNKIGTFPIQKKSQIIDIPPFWNGINWTPIHPIIVYAISTDSKSLDTDIQWIIAHEIVHYLSIGPYLQTENNKWKHFLGVNEMVYAIEDNMFQKIDGESIINNRFNEFFTDYTVWHLMKKAHGCIPPLYDLLEYFDDYLKTHCNEHITESVLVGWYLSGRNDEMKKFLLGSKYNNYDEFCLAIYNKEL